MNKLIYSVNELFRDFLQGAKFIIPNYQRGYKWSGGDVQTLLDDVNAFECKGDDDVFYCLQNITLVSVKDTDGKENYRVVDGQQRLTTLTLIMSCFGEIELVKNHLEYQIREESNAFLKDIVFSKDGVHSFANNTVGSPLKEWDDLTEIDNYNFQDIYYLYTAIKTIEEWLQNNCEKSATLKEKFLNKVKLIVNCTPLNENQEIELFNNLNGKRVPLDGADLIRAMIVTRKSRNDVADIAELQKQNVLLNECRVKIGLQLDRINAWWSNKERQEYFKVFTFQIKSANQQVKFDESQYGIDCLYKLYVQTDKGHKNLNLSSSDKIIQLSSFEKADVDCLYDNLVELQRLVEYWYDDEVLYHLIQFVALYLKLSFEKLSELWYKSDKNNFISSLKSLIRESPCVKNALRTSVGELGQSKLLTDDELNWDEDWHSGDDKTDLIQISVLLDVIDILKSRQEANQLPLARLDAKHFKKVNEDMEHIFPQTPLGNDFSKAQLLSYVDLIYDFVAEKGGTDNREKAKNLIELNESALLCNERKDRVKLFVNNILTVKFIPVGSLGNMCLLESSTNRSYGNDFFTQKYYDIVKNSRNGHYIRPHVLDAFTKAMANDGERDNLNYMQRWNATDIYNRREFIVNQIKSFLDC